MHLACARPACKSPGTYPSQSERRRQHCPTQSPPLDVTAPAPQHRQKHGAQQQQTVCAVTSQLVQVESSNNQNLADTRRVRCQLGCAKRACRTDNLHKQQSDTQGRHTCGGWLRVRVLLDKGVVFTAQHQGAAERGENNHCFHRTQSSAPQNQTAKGRTGASGRQAEQARCRPQPHCGWQPPSPAPVWVFLSKLR